MKKIFIFISLLLFPLWINALEINDIDDFKSAFGEENISIDYDTKTVKLLNNSTLSNSVEITAGDYIIDFNNMIVDVKNCNQHIFEIDGATVTFSNANFDFSTRTLNNNFLITNGVLNINGGKYINSDQGLFISKATSSTEFVEVNVYGGTFSARRVFDMKDTSYNHHSKLNIYGGDFGGYVNEDTYAVIDIIGVDLTIGNIGDDNDNIYVHSVKTNLISASASNTVINSGTFYISNSAVFGLTLNNYIDNYSTTVAINGGIFDVQNNTRNGAIMVISGDISASIDNAKIGLSSPTNMCLSINVNDLTITNSQIKVDTTIYSDQFLTTDTIYGDMYLSSAGATGGSFSINDCTINKANIDAQVDLYIDNLELINSTINSNNIYLSNVDFTDVFLGSIEDIIVTSGNFVNFSVLYCGGQVVLNGGNYTGLNGYGVLNLGEYSYVINGGTFTGDVILYSWGDGVINGGTFNADTLFYFDLLKLVINDGEFNLTNGLFELEEIYDTDEPTRESVKELYLEYGYDLDYINENIDDLYQEEYDNYLYYFDNYNNLLSLDIEHFDGFDFELYISGGTFNVLNNLIVNKNNYYTSKIVLNGGIFNVNKMLLDIDAVGNYLEIDNGTFTTIADNLITIDSNGYTKITGGTFNSNLISLLVKDNHNYHITGGTYHTNSPLGKAIFVNNDSAYNLLDIGYGYLDDNITYFDNNIGYTKSITTVAPFKTAVLINSNGNITSTNGNASYDIPAGTLYENTIKASYGYKIVSIKINGNEILTKNDLKNNILSYDVSFKNYVDTVIQVKTEKIIYIIISGNNQSLINTYDMNKIRIDSEYSNFSNGKVYIDGVLVNKDNYTSEEGSTIIKFKEEFLKTLDKVTHTITVEFNDGGIANGNFEIGSYSNNNPGNNPHKKPNKGKIVPTSDIEPNPNTGAKYVKNIMYIGIFLMLFIVADVIVIKLLRRNHN